MSLITVWINSLYAHYSSDLTRGDLFLFPNWKNKLAVIKFSSDMDISEAKFLVNV